MFPKPYPTVQEMTDEERRRLAIATLHQLGIRIDDDATWEQIRWAGEAVIAAEGKQ